MNNLFFIKDDALWACLAAMSISSKDLKTAEIAYAAIKEVNFFQILYFYLYIIKQYLCFAYFFAKLLFVRFILISKSIKIRILI